MFCLPVRENADNVTTQYTYYIDGLRKSKKVGTGETKYFIWSNGNMVYEFTATDDIAYFFGLHLVSSDDYRYVLNAHGDVVALVNASGNVVRRYEYDAFGVELNPDETDTNPYRYCAEYFDVESGTIYLRARYYSPNHGRFTQLDPARDGLNWYAYCYNNPAMWVDYWGLKPGDKFDSADDAAVDFGKEYNEKSIETDTEYGTVIYKVTVYGTKTITYKILGIIPITKTVTDYDTIVEEYYTYSEPIEGTDESVPASSIPESDDASIEYTEKAQIHTHGSFHYRVQSFNSSGQSVRTTDSNGFSKDDIIVARMRGVDTYVVTQWGDLFKATYGADYKDKGYPKSPYMESVFAYDKKIIEIYGGLKRI